MYMLTPNKISYILDRILERTRGGLYAGVVSSVLYTGKNGVIFDIHIDLPPNNKNSRLKYNLFNKGRVMRLIFRNSSSLFLEYSDDIYRINRTYRGYYHSSVLKYKNDFIKIVRSLEELHDDVLPDVCYDILDGVIGYVDN